MRGVDRRGKGKPSSKLVRIEKIPPMTAGRGVMVPHGSKRCKRGKNSTARGKGEHTHSRPEMKVGASGYLEEADRLNKVGSVELQ